MDVTGYKGFKQISFEAIEHRQNGAELYTTIVSDESLIITCTAVQHKSNRMPKTKEELAREAAEKKKSREDRHRKRDTQADGLGAAVTAGSLGKGSSRRQTAGASEGEESPVKKLKQAESHRRSAPAPSSSSSSVSDSGSSDSDEVAVSGAKLTDPDAKKGAARLKERTLHIEKVDSYCVVIIYVQ